MNYFELYDLPVGFTIAKDQLKRKYYQLSKQHHPDFFDKNTGITEEENLLLSSKVNEGYALLQQDYAVIEYILQLKGLISPNEKYSLPNEFLMEIMELNEDLQQDNTKEIEQLSEKIRTPIADLLAFTDIAPLTETDLLKVKDYFFKEKYLRRLRDRAKGLENFD